MSSLVDGLTDDERHYFESGGDVNENLARTGGPSLSPDQPKPAEPTPPAPAPQRDAPPPPAAVAGEDEDGVDDPLGPGETVPKRVRRSRYLALDNQRRDLERQLNERTLASARVEERLKLLQEALQPAQDPGPAAPERPDPNQDIFAYLKWSEDRYASMEAKIAQYEEQIATGQAEMEEQNRYIGSMNEYAAQEPHFVQAYNFLLRNRAAELMAPRYPQATYEQLMGAQIPADIGQILKQEERDLYKTAFQHERNPAAEILRMAQLRGWRRPEKETLASQVVAQETALSGSAQIQQKPQGPFMGAPQAAAPAAAAQPAPAQTATAMVEAIKRGQPAAQSLSHMSGNAVTALTELTPQMLGDMSPEEFGRVMSDLMASGNNKRIRELMGD